MMKCTYCKEKQKCGEDVNKLFMRLPTSFQKQVCDQVGTSSSCDDKQCILCDTHFWKGVRNINSRFAKGVLLAALNAIICDMSGMDNVDCNNMKIYDNLDKNS